MRPYHPDTDPATIPDAVLHSEYGRRARAKRKTPQQAGPGRPTKDAVCKLCGLTGTATDIARHKCPARPDRRVKMVSCPDCGVTGRAMEMRAHRCPPSEG